MDETRRRRGQCGIFYLERGNWADAGAWTRKAAENGFAPAQTHLGLFYVKGDGVPRDAEAGARWFERAAQQVDASADYNLANCYERGEGVDRDLQKARSYFERAAERGYGDAAVRANAIRVP